MKRKPKIGSGHTRAFFRQGLDELRNALYPDSNIAQKQVESGIYGSPTSGEIGNDRQQDANGSGRMSVLGKKIAQAIRESKAVTRDDHEPERD